MTECETCGTIHGTRTYRHQNETVTYCVHCEPEDAEVADDGPRVIEYPDRR